MINKWLSNSKKSRKKICRIGDLEMRIPEQNLEEVNQDKILTKIYIYGEFTEEHKSRKQDCDRINVIYCPPLTEEQKMKNSKEFENFNGFICQPFYPSNIHFDKKSLLSKLMELYKRMIKR